MTDVDLARWALALTPADVPTAPDGTFYVGRGLPVTDVGLWLDNLQGCLGYTGPDLDEVRATALDDARLLRAALAGATPAGVDGTTDEPSAAVVLAGARSEVRRPSVLSLAHDPETAWSEALGAAPEPVRDVLRRAAEAGIDAAFAEMYGSASAQDLTTLEAATLAGLFVSGVFGAVASAVRECGSRSREATAGASNADEVGEALGHALAVVVGAALSTRDRLHADART